MFCVLIDCVVEHLRVFSHCRASSGCVDEKVNTYQKIKFQQITTAQSLFATQRNNISWTTAKQKHLTKRCLWCLLRPSSSRGQVGKHASLQPSGASLQPKKNETEKKRDTGDSEPAEWKREKRKKTWLSQKRRRDAAHLSLIVSAPFCIPFLVLYW